MEAALTGGVNRPRARRGIQQVPELDLLGAAQNKRAFNNILEFTDISRLVIGRQTGKHLIGNTGNFFAWSKLKRLMKCPIRRGTSSLRSRSGGIWSFTTLIRS
jgi:hypothetical protein